MKRILTMTLVAVTCVSLTGCRQSDVIQELVDNVEAEQTDQVAQNHSEDGETDDDALLARASEDGDTPGQEANNKDASERQKDQEQENRTGGTSTSDTSEQDGTNAKMQNGDSGSGGAAGSGQGEPGNSAAGDGSGDNAGGNQEGGSSPDGSGDVKTDDNGEDKEDDSSGDDDEQDEDENNSSHGKGSAPLSPDDENARQIKDSSGNEVYIPNNVSKVAAPGEAAVIAQMLAGENTLVAASEDFMDNELTMRVFADELTGDLVSVWEDEDDRSMSDSDFQTLLDADPDCVILISENTFTEEQQAELTENSIGVVLLPKLSTTANIKEAVKIVGQVLKNNQSSQVDSVSLADRYCDYMDSLIARVKRNGNGLFSPDGVNYDIDSWYEISFNTPTASQGRFTVYIDDWGEGLHYDCLSDNQKYIIYQDGIALSTSSFGVSPVYYFMTVGGVFNTTTDWRETSLSGHIAQALYQEVTNYYYDYGTGSMEVHGEGYYYRGSGLRYFRFERYGIEYHLGTEEFPAVIVKDKYIKECMEASKNSRLGMYRPADFLNTDHTQQGWLVDEDTDASQITAENEYELDHYPRGTDIWGDYDIYINPTGVGDWTGQSIESVLETIWASCTFYDESYFTLSDVVDEVADFYETFYRYEVTDSDLTDILQLDEN